MHRVVGGLAPADDPTATRWGLTRAMARHQTPYGLAKSRWTIDGGAFQLDVVVPANTTAAVTLPGQESAPLEVGSGVWRWSVPYRDPDARGPYNAGRLDRRYPER